MVPQSLLLLAIGLSGSLALPNPMVQPINLATILDSSLVYRAGTTYKVPREIGEVDPSTCPTIKCASEFHPQYHPDTKRCTCEPDTPSKCPKIICASGTNAIWVAGDKTCTCKVVNPVPPTCPQMKCISGNHVVYHPETNICSCDPVCPGLMCIATMIPYHDPTTNVCSCQKIPGLEDTIHVSRELQDRDDVMPDPNHAQCADLMCIDEKYPFFNETSGECECVYHPELTHPFFCADTICIAEMEPIFNTSSRTCYCEWLPDFFPKRATLPVDSDDELPTAVSSEQACTSMVCISEMKPVWDESANTCKCEWITGLQPSPISTPTKPASPSSKPTAHHPCPKIFCIAGQQLVFNPTTGICRCEPIPLATPTSITSPSSKPTAHHSCPKIFCIAGQQLVFNPTTGICRCEPIPLATPTSTTSNFPRALLNEKSVPACFNATSNHFLTCPDPLETPHWAGGHCVCDSTTSTTSTKKPPTITPKPTSTTSTTRTPTITSKPATTSKATNTFKTSTTTKKIPSQG